MVCDSTDLTGHDGRQVLLLVHQHQVLQGPRLEEEGVSLLQGHGGGELRLLVIVAQVGDLVQVAEGDEGGVTKSRTSDNRLEALEG